MKTILGFIYFIVYCSVLNAQTLNEAIRMTENEQFESANKVFENLVIAEPTNGNYFYYYGENYFKNDLFDKAKEKYQKGIEVNPNNAINYVGLGKIQQAQGNRTDADANFFKAKTISQSKSAPVLMELADVYINADVKKIPEAITLLNQASVLEPKNPEIYTLIGDAYLEQNDGNMAIANYEKALNIDKKFTKAILREGKLYSRAKNYNLALDYYNKAIAIDSTFAPAFRERAELRFRAGQAERATADYEKYLKLNDNISARIRHASFKFVSKKYKEAVEEINAIQKKDTTDINMYRLLGYSLYETGDYVNGMMNMNKFFIKANAVGKKMLASDYEYLGKNQVKAGKDSLGTISLLKAIQMDSTKTDLYSDIASGCLKQKNYPCAIMYYDKKIEASKDKIGGANDYYGLGRAYYFSKDYVKGDSAFAQLTRLQPNLPVGHLWRARCESQFDLDSKKGLAAPHYEKYIEKVGADVEKNKKDLIEAYEYLGYYNMLKKDYPKAKESWNKLKEIDPTNVKAKKALADPNLK
ncbi:MAG: tetratricopeptide repeat protein [Bacteroidetes bacterium]|nr:tetratricopeptide repeat protein [Bacteroidota bacterium]